LSELHDYRLTSQEQLWQPWLVRLYNLRRDKRGSHERSHKPVLLLSIIDLLDRGIIRKNEVPLSEELVETFKRNLGGLGHWMGAMPLSKLDLCGKWSAKSNKARAGVRRHATT
jgi:predicted restriction endonuclease